MAALQRSFSPFQLSHFFFYICCVLSDRHAYINGLPLRCVSSTCSASCSTSAPEQSRLLQQEMPRQTEPWSVFLNSTYTANCTICHLWNMLPSLISLPGTGGIFCAWIYVHLDRIDIYDWCNLVCNGYSLQVKEINRLSLVQHFVSPILKHTHSRSNIS